MVKNSSKTAKESVYVTIFHTRYNIDTLVWGKDEFILLNKLLR